MESPTLMSGNSLILLNVINEFMEVDVVEILYNQGFIYISNANNVANRVRTALITKVLQQTHTVLIQNNNATANQNNNSPRTDSNPRG